MTTDEIVVVMRKAIRGVRAAFVRAQPDGTIVYGADTHERGQNVVRRVNEALRDAGLSWRLKQILRDNKAMRWTRRDMGTYVENLHFATVRVVDRAAPAKQLVNGRLVKV